MGSNKNRKNSVRNSAKNNLSGTTSMINNGIQDVKTLSKCDKHNYRKYDNEQEQIVIVRGTSSLYEDVQDFYKTVFEEARIEYNNRQTRDDRKINDYFKKVSENSKSDLACEIIIELGDKKFWDTKDLDYKKKMTEVYKKQVDDLELIVPNFIVCSAIIHYDETSPHVHVVGVPIKYNCKTGMSIQVGKTDVFTRESLRQIQDKMRTLCIEEYNNEYNLSSTLKKKLKGRNRDIHISNMDNYQETKDLIEKNQKNIDSINNKSLELEKENLNIKYKITTLKKAPLTKDTYLISSEDKQKIESYIDKIDKVNEEYRSIKELSSSLNSLSQTIKEDKETIKILTENNKSLELRVSNLTSKNSMQEEKIDELRKDNFNLKYRVQQLEEFFNKLIKLIKNMFKRNDKKEQYAEFANDLYRHQIISDKTMEDIRIAYNTKTKEKDDFEL